jgi:hypothetical protein
MKRYIAVAFAASTLLLAGCCTTPQATKWEYKVAAGPHLPAGSGPQEYLNARQAFLNDLGKDGWLLISQSDERTFYFRRPIR